MLVYLLFFIDILFKIKRYKVPIQIIVLMITTFLIALLFSLGLFSSSDELNLGTTGSDTLYYYKIALEIKSNPSLLFDYFMQHSGAYICLLSITLITTPFDSSYVLIFLNIIILIDLLLTIYIYLNKKGFTESFQITLIISLSGGMLLVGIQILKDIFLLFIFIELLLVNFNKISIIKTILLLIVANLTRPHIWIIMLPLMLIDYKINKQLIINKYLKPLFKPFILLIGISLISVFYFSFQDIIELSIKIANQTALRDMSNYGSALSGDFLIDLPLYLKLPISMAKFILLPLPFASLMSDETNYMIKILYFIQALIFHLLLFSIILSLPKIKDEIRKILPLFLFVVFYTLVYSLIYLGNADMRLRLPMILLITILGVVSMKKLTYKKENINILIILSLTYVSVPSLYKFVEFKGLILNIIELFLLYVILFIMFNRANFFKRKLK